jgi:hypothetical protein
MKRIFLLLSLMLTGFAFHCFSESLPASLNDKDFWQMIARFSEPGAEFNNGNSNNVISNEAQYQSRGLADQQRSVGLQIRATQDICRCRCNVKVT